MRRLKRGLPGLVEVPALKELNDIREHTGHDLSVLDRDSFHDVARTLTNGTFSDNQLDDAYDQLHLIVEAGGSEAPMYRVVPSASTKGKNVGKYDIEYIAADPEAERLQNMKSREMSAVAMLDDNELLPVQTNKGYLNDTKDSVSKFLTTGAIAKLGNSGFRAKKQQGEELLAAAVQNLNDASGGYDRMSRDVIFNQPIEFGHYVPHNQGGEDLSSNGRMQAMSANRAMGDRLGVPGAMSALSGDYVKMKDNVKRYAGDVFFVE